MEKLDSVEITINLHSATHRSFYLCITHSATHRSFYLCTHRSYYLCITHADVQDNRVTTPWIWSACTFCHISSTVKKQNKERINLSVLSGTARKKVYKIEFLPNRNALAASDLSFAERILCTCIWLNLKKKIKSQQINLCILKYILICFDKNVWSTLGRHGLKGCFSAWQKYPKSRFC